MGCISNKQQRRPKQITHLKNQANYDLNHFDLTDIAHRFKNTQVKPPRSIDYLTYQSEVIVTKKADDDTAQFLGKNLYQIGGNAKQILCDDGQAKMMRVPKVTYPKLDLNFYDLSHDR